MEAKDDRENKRIDTQAEIAGAKIAVDSIEAQQKMDAEKEEREEKDFKEGVKIGLEGVVAQTDK